MLYWLYDVGQASDMRALVWNNELEAVAQRWADQCTFGHDSVSIVMTMGDLVMISTMKLLFMTSWCSSRLLLLKPSSEPSNVRRNVSWAKCLHEHVLPGCQHTFSKFASSQRLSNDLQHLLRFLKTLHSRYDLKYLSIGIHVRGEFDFWKPPWKEKALPTRLYNNWFIISTKKSTPMSSTKC